MLPSMKLEEPVCRLPDKKTLAFCLVLLCVFITVIIVGHWKLYTLALVIVLCM